VALDEVELNKDATHILRGLRCAESTMGASASGSGPSLGQCALDEVARLARRKSYDQ